MSSPDYEIDINPPSQSFHGSGVEASSNNPCSCCGGASWCFILDDGNANVCGRTDIPPEGWKRTGTAKDGRNIYRKVGTQQRVHKHRGILPDPIDIRLKPQPLTDFPQWLEIGRDAAGIRELQIEYLFPDAETCEPLGKIVRRQHQDRRRVYNNSKDTKHIRPHHWHFNNHPSVMQGFWTDRGKGNKPWPLIAF